MFANSVRESKWKIRKKNLWFVKVTMETRKLIINYDDDLLSKYIFK